MRRADRARDLAFSYELIDRCTHGVVAVADEDGLPPYCLPLSLVRVDNSLYFHGAKLGRKLDMMRKHPRVCVTFVGKDEPAFLPPYQYTTFFQSVIAVGTAREVEDREERVMALKALCLKMTPDAVFDDVFDMAIKASYDHTAVWRIDMDEITGKEKAPKK